MRVALDSSWRFGALGILVSLHSSLPSNLIRFRSILSTSIELPVKSRSEDTQLVEVKRRDYGTGSHGHAPDDGQPVSMLVFSNP